MNHATHLKWADRLSKIWGPPLSEFRIEASDLTDRKLPERLSHICVFDRNNRRVSFGDIQKYPVANFRIEKSTPFDLINSELRRLNLLCVGILDVDESDPCTRPDGSNALPRVLAVTPIDGDLFGALERIKQSPIHFDAPSEEQPFAIAESGNEDAARAVIANDRAQSITDTSQFGDPANKMIVIDARAASVNWATPRLQQLPNRENNRLIRASEDAQAIIAAQDPELLFSEVEDGSPVTFPTDDNGEPEYEVLRFMFSGVDQTARKLTRDAIPNDNLGSGIAPRINYSKESVGLGSAALSGALPEDTRGVVVFIHGFDNEADLNPVTESDLLASSESDMLNTLWPNVQTLYNDHGLPDDVAIIHVFWTGKWFPDDLGFGARLDKAQSPLWFNADNAIGHITGKVMILRLLRDLHLYSLQRTGNEEWLGVTLHANSLGGRVAASAAGALADQTGADGVPDADSDTYPLIKAALGHPALRRDNFDRNLLQQLRDANGGNLPRPNTDLQHDFRLLSERGQPLLAFISEFDKAGLAFKIAQRTEMMGRCGLPPGYDRANDPLSVHTFWANKFRENRDLWHVRAMGWTLPGVAFESRPTYARNFFFDYPKLSNQSTLGFLREGGLLASTDLVIRLTPGHLEPIWTSYAEYATESTIPDRTVVEGSP